MFLVFFNFRYDTEFIFDEVYNSSSNNPYGLDFEIETLITGTTFDMCPS